MKLVHVAWIKIHIMRQAPDDSVRVHTSVCGGGHYLYSLYETDHLPTSASVGLELRKAVFKRVILLYDGRLGRRNSRSDRETHGQKGLNQRGGVTDKNSHSLSVNISLK